MKGITTIVVLALALLAAGCGGDEAAGGPLTVYSGREEELVAPLFEKFTDATGVDVEVRYGDSAELAATIAEEGDNSPADVFFAQDPGSLGAVDPQLEELPQATLDRVAARFRDAEGRWVGTSGRTRVLAYNTDRVQESDLPASVLELTRPEWKGRVGVAPTNASFQAFVTAMRLSLGDERTREWLEALRANGAKTYEKNLPIVEAVAAGEVDVGLVNHYYLALVKEEQPDAPVANHLFEAGDPGTLVSVAGAGVLASTDQRDDAEAFVEFLLSEDAQRFYVDQAEENEYPLVAGIDPPAGLVPLDEIQGPDVELTAFGAELESTVELLRETGWLS
ncbi:iron ABC transporter substrate-binding protein [Gaiella sp.]|jgi:iron(III) transport system substrate-binding protein|uniref:iron ABC transporter substrate-binding protein n=1 Tax=Gaiella sp. TaxID=2663207 RepID=UPI002BFBE5BA|nr:iron ABC transporter substrate-binding protein [Gaiella sp.]HWO79419.1 iron ABC transporter substrate-binding protein [Gaiella sp.]